jgi:hypothetical protein
MKILNRDIKLEGAWVYVVILLFAVAFIAVSVSFGIFEIEILPSQFYGALIGVVITAIITVLLLQGQTAKEEEHEKNVKVFEKKQEIYHTFLEKLQVIIQDGEITIGKKIDDKGTIDRSVDELKDIIFQLCYLQLHSRESTVNDILDHIAGIIMLMNGFNAKNESDKQKEMADYYANLSGLLSNMTVSLRKDLYDNVECEPISSEKMNEVLKACNLFIETNGIDKYDTQKYFWSELIRGLRERGYAIADKDFTEDIDKYYKKKKGRYFNQGITFEVYRDKSDKPVNFGVYIHNRYFYSFQRDHENQSYPAIEELFKGSNYMSTSWSFGHKYADRLEYDVDFWPPHNLAFQTLSHPLKRADLMSKIVDEIDRHIKAFVTKAKAANI